MISTQTNKKPRITYQFGIFLGAYRYRAQLHYEGKTWTEIDKKLETAIRRVWFLFVTRDVR